jgi:hypothetical protein
MTFGQRIQQGVLVGDVVIEMPMDTPARAATLLVVVAA